MHTGRRGAGCIKEGGPCTRRVHARGMGTVCIQEGGVQGAYRKVGHVGCIQEGGSYRLCPKKVGLVLQGAYEEQQPVYNHKVKQYSRQVPCSYFYLL